jgi:RNA polymerase sigma-70 factor (ECF subfamily)
MGVQQLREVMNKVNEEFREVVYLRDFEEMTYEEIVEITDLPMGTVKSRINRGRAQIQSFMKEYVKAGTF